MRIYTLPVLIAGALSLGSCVTSSTDQSPKPLTEKQAKQLDKALKGKVAGKPVNCISNFGNVSSVRISDDIMLYNPGGSTVYKNELRRTCRGLADDDDIIVIRNTGSSYCKNETFQLVDRFSGIPGPVCSWGEFVPYRDPK